MSENTPPSTATSSKPYNVDSAIEELRTKIAREQAMMTGAAQMKNLSSNPQVKERLEREMRDNRRVIEYLEEKLKAAELKKLRQNASTDSAAPGSYPARYESMGAVDANSAAHAMSQMSLNPQKARPNYTRLELLKYDTKHLGPRVQMMYPQLEFRIGVEKQYIKGISKLVRLYTLEKDTKSLADAEAKNFDSTEKLKLLNDARKGYSSLHLTFSDDETSLDGENIGAPTLRRPISGRVKIHIHQIRDLGIFNTSRFSRAPETYIVIKAEDTIKCRTKPSRNMTWTDQPFQFDVNKANEIELTVYATTKNDKFPRPIGMFWVRLSDITEEQRKKKVELESHGWVSADKAGEGTGSQTHFSPPPTQPLPPGQQAQPQPPVDPKALAASSTIDAWFALIPQGRIRLTIDFTKTNNENRRPNAFNAGLGRQGAIRQQKKEIHEQCGHKFVVLQSYALLRCAYCEELMSGGTAQCTECQYACHEKCYPNVVIKCITQSNSETDPDEAKLNHRIPHRFEPYPAITPSWCCHCGHILPLGRKQRRKCNECSVTCHAQCVHLVPDFCGLSAVTANKILGEIQKQQQLTANRQHTKPKRPIASSSGSSALTATETKPSPGHSKTPSQGTSPYLRQQQYADRNSTVPDPAHRMSASQSAAAAAAAAMGSYGQFAQPSYNPADYAGVDQPYQHNMMSPQQHFPPIPPPHQEPMSLPQQQYQQYPPQTMNMPQSPQQNHSLLPQPLQPLQQVQIQQGSPQQKMVPKKPTPAATTAGSGRRIGLDHFNFLAVLGKGNFGKVMLAETKAEKQLYAIKVLKKEFIIQNDEVESIRSEKRVFLVANKEQHPFLLNLHACFQTETRVYFVMEYISGGDLMWHIQRGNFGTKRAQFYAAEVCLALKYFHENGVIYRDLKLDNILLTLDGHIKIGDYGLCKEDMWYGSQTGTFCGTPEFMAPEILLDKKYGRAVDWWAYGVLIYQMLLQQSPFKGEDEDEIYDAILADEPLYPIQMPRDSVSILQKLLTRDPGSRLGSGPTDAQEVMSHPFFRDINWDDVYHKRIPAPVKPQIKSPTDTSNFDSEFTSVTPVLTPVQSVLSPEMQEEFRGFSYASDQM